ncbi:reverse transcriptase domain protein [Lasallia pustulata]|uniref:Reverse transcriptase domain protein n=1 Tax=Lasallia pustulata TaxID=136370 RepID=A0A1W5CXA3_9LECA|nr:reverse transcriptase domain protein [Lasallia pustulata]
MDQPWKTIAFNFIVKLPVSQEPVTQQYYDTILVLTDKLTKYGKFVPYLEGSTATELAYTFYKHIVADHGLPTQIITDWDKLVRKKGPSLEEGDKVYLLQRNIRTKRPAKKLDHTKLGPFCIKKKLGPNMYELQLPDSMKIHPVFHATVLEPAHPSIPIATQVPTLEMDDNKKVYNVEKVLQSRLENGKLQYLVKWKGYSMNDNTWEPASQFTSKKVLQDFDRHHPEQPKAGTREVPQNSMARPEAMRNPRMKNQRQRKRPAG